MRAIRQDIFGGPEVLKLIEAPDPIPLPTEVVVRVRAAGLNPVEEFIRDGRFPLLGEPPFTLGWDVSGVVDEVVPGVTRFTIGDEVFGMPFFPRPANAFAERVAAPSRQLVRKPPTMSHEEAGALPLAGLTAWQSLVDTAQVKAGDRVLVHAAGGGVGHLAVQIAKALGAYVIGTASAAKRDFVKSLGADEVIDYQTTDFAEQAREVDVVLESVGGDYGERSLSTLRPGGLLVTIVGRTDAELARKTHAAGMRFAGISVEPDHSGLEALAQLFEAKQLKVHVARAFPLSQAAEAYRFLAAAPPGKVVLVP